MLRISGHGIICSFCFSIFCLNLYKSVQLLWAVGDKVFLYSRGFSNLCQILCLKAVSSSFWYMSHCVFSTKSWSTLRTLTMTLQHAVDVQIFESAPEFLRSLNSGSCPLDGRCWCISETGRSLVWNSPQIGRPWLTSAWRNVATKRAPPF